MNKPNKTLEDLKLLQDPNVQMPKLYSFTEVRELLQAQQDKFSLLIAEEMNIANKEGTPTSRLTSLINKLN